MTVQIQNPSIEFHSVREAHGYDNAVIGWEVNGVRYHAWLAVDATSRITLNPFEIQSGVVYKRPPEGLKKGQHGWFDTRRLDAGKAVNKAMLAKAIQAIDYSGERAKAIEAEQIKRKARRDAATAEQRRAILNVAAPALLVAAKLARDVLVDLQQRSPSIDAAADALMSAIEEAEKVPS